MTESPAVPCGRLIEDWRALACCQSIVDDAEVGHLLHDPFGLRVEPGLPLAGVRILDEALPVPHQAADIHLVIEEAVATLGIADDGREAPVPSGGARYALAVQLGRNSLGRLARNIVGEDAVDGRCLRFVDGPVAADRLTIGVQPLHHVIAVGLAATGLAGLHPTPEPPPSLVGEVFEEQRVHRAL